MFKLIAFLFLCGVVICSAKWASHFVNNDEYLYGNDDSTYNTDERD